MQNQQIIDQITNLKGRKNYEEKKAAKLGFSSLYEYFEDKIAKEKTAAEEKVNYLKQLSVQKELLIKSKIEKKTEEKNSCKCC
tara:strand:- start:195 stop:443 length:249 start_codon:yes stop_codon:yes gene_type:complete